MRKIGLGIAALMVGMSVLLPAAMAADTGAAATPAKAPAKTEIKKVDGEKLPVVEWDFREARDPAKAGWPSGEGKNNTYTIEGDFEFKLHVQDGKDIDQHVRQVDVRKDGSYVESVEMTTAAQATEDAYKNAKRLLTSLGFDKTAMDQLDQWHAKAAKGNFDNLELKVTNSYDRVYVVHVTNDGTSDHPWSLGLDVDWSNVCGCHG